MAKTDSGASTTAKLVLLLCFVGAIAVTYWGLAFNQGTLTINSQVVPFEIDGVFDTPYVCETAPCNLELKPKLYNVILTADTYSPDKQSVVVKRGKTTELAFDSFKLPEVVEIDLNRETNLREYFYDRASTDETIEIWLRSPQGDQLLTRLPEGTIVEQVLFEPGHPYALIKTDDAILEIHVPSTRKRSVVINNDWLNYKVLGASYIAWETEQGVYFDDYNLESEEGKPLPVSGLDSVSALDNNTFLLLGDFDEVNEVSIIDVFRNDLAVESAIDLAVYDLATQQVRPIASISLNVGASYGFLERLNYEENGKAIIVKADGTNYLIEGLEF